MMNEDTNRIIVLGNVPPANNEKWHQRNDVFSIEGVCNTLTATSYKDPSRIMVKYYDKE